MRWGGAAGGGVLSMHLHMETVLAHLVFQKSNTSPISPPKSLRIDKPFDLLIDPNRNDKRAEKRATNPVESGKGKGKNQKVKTTEKIINKCDLQEK
jgi:hypothetical protein